MRSIVLTGASGGIGAALVRRLAMPGRRLLLLGRAVDRLETVAATARAAGAEAETATIPVEDASALGKRLRDFDREGAVDLLVANAGRSGGRGPDGTGETAASVAALAAVNYLGAVNTVEPLLGAMRARGAGRIAVVSSLAAIRPLPGMRGYAGSKAALSAYATALRADLRGTGVSLSLVIPGFVATAMTARHRGPTPFAIDADRAAEHILAGIARRRGVIAFPWQTALMARAGALLPPAIADRLARAVDAAIEPDA